MPPVVLHINYINLYIQIPFLIMYENFCQLWLFIFLCPCIVYLNQFNYTSFVSLITLDRLEQTHTNSSLQSNILPRINLLTIINIVINNCEQILNLFKTIPTHHFLTCTPYAFVRCIKIIQYILGHTLYRKLSIFEYTYTRIIIYLHPPTRRCYFLPIAVDQ